ncbi:TetR family transcriptional regulator [Corynebacterium minutissimum]|uniref:TetR family transcriptional regulator n=1 Tax=Corynebacterium minutissimum TaxID=38301 RepID=UPI001EF174C8|nr:TetR family transcriptional regulator [Corynebacterium minutissimum]MCG7239305.1 TetR family transcriptional regulator [Corynebacterium minutissimum]
MHLSRDAIVSTALELLTSYGLADVTMRRVATTLGVAPGALYWHVANKQALIAAMATEIISPVSGDTPAELASSLHRELSRWRDGAEVAIAGAAFPESTARADLEELFAAALEREVPEGTSESIGVAARTLIHYILGATFLEQSHAQLGGVSASAHTDDASIRATELVVAGLRAL